MLRRRVFASFPSASLCPSLSSAFRRAATSTAAAAPPSALHRFPGLEGKVCVVTGSSAGIGKAIATTLAHSGATVVINGRSEKSCAQAAADIQAVAKCGAAALVPIPGDVSTTAGADAFIAAVRVSAACRGFVDVLVNNAGTYSEKDFFAVDDSEWEAYMTTNVLSGVRLSRAFMKPMLERNAGRVIFISSEAGVRTLPHMLPYSVTKSAQIALARGLAELTKGHGGVTVNTVLPGPTRTPGVQSYIENYGKERGMSAAEAEKTYFQSGEPNSLIQRFLEPEEIANTVAFVASDSSSGINGASIRCEGGLVRHV